MRTSVSSSRRHRAERNRSDRSSGGSDGGGGLGRGGGRSGNSGGGRLRRLVLVLAVALAWTRPNSLLAEAACAGGLEGIPSDDGTICCLQACGQCGGSGCSDIEGTEETDCCTADISSAGVICGDNGAVAPCIVQPTPSPTMAPSTAPQTGGTAQPSAPTSTGTVPPATAQPTPLNATSVPTAEPTAAPVDAAAAAVTPAPEQTIMPTAALIPTPVPTALTPTPSPTTVVPATPLPTAAPAPAPAPAAVPTAAPVADAVGTVAPTTGASSTCDNGYPGWQSDEACCSDFCGKCGGSGCGTLGSADCCVDNVMAAELVCGVDVFEAPCIVPALGEGETYAPVGAPTLPNPSLAPSPAAAAATLAPGGVGATPTLAPSGSREVVGGTEAPSPPAAGDDIDSTGTPGMAPTSPPVGTSAPAGTSAPMEASAPITPECAEGIAGFAHDVVCCPVACGQCGGSGCENIEGTAGASDCCSDVILTSGQTCDATGGVSPCILSAVDAVSGSTDASAARSSIRMSGVAAEGRGVAWVFAALSAAGFMTLN